jgi:glycolate oxidase iron-sulfur subunit
VIRRGRGCCGALSLQAGREAEAVGCDSGMKEYEQLLSQAGVGWAERAAEMSGKVRDLSEFLTEIGPAAWRHPRPPL